ncbi:MAG: nicotinamide mononucleotide transporter [Bacteroidia bacterium]|nr:nicotinamide mononucleotide transporter [Bacteroidia bacterium]
MPWLELTAVLFSLACVVLSMRRHILNWPAGLIGVSAYFLLFFQAKLYADMGLQVIFFVQGIYGWINWQQSQKAEQQTEVPIARLSLRGRIIYLGAMGGGITGLYFALRHFTDAAMPLWDTTASVSSLTANWLMARRVVESWILWILADILYIGLFMNRELYLSSGIYVVFLGLSTWGLLRWMKELKQSPRIAPF